MLKVEQYEFIRTGYRVYGLSISEKACSPQARKPKNRSARPSSIWKRTKTYSLPWRPDRRLSHRKWGHRIGKQVCLPCSSQKKRSLVAQGKQQQDAGPEMRELKLSAARLQQRRLLQAFAKRRLDSIPSLV